ncbi:MAG: NifU N-terminal domain-containing protein [Acidimicrobiales bacterium]
MATATPSPDASPNPNALKFDLDAPLPEMINFTSAADAEAAGQPFAAAVLAVEGVVSLFGTASFVTVSRVPGTDWDPISEAVQAAAAAHL